MLLKIQLIRTEISGEKSLHVSGAFNAFLRGYFYTGSERFPEVQTSLKSLLIDLLCAFLYHTGVKFKSLDVKVTMLHHFIPIPKSKTNVTSDI